MQKNSPCTSWRCDRCQGQGARKGPLSAFVPLAFLRALKLLHAPKCLCCVFSCRRLQSLSGRDFSKDRLKLIAGLFATAKPLKPPAPNSQTPTEPQMSFHVPGPISASEGELGTALRFGNPLQGFVLRAFGFDPSVCFKNAVEDKDPPETIFATCLLRFLQDCRAHLL